ncbi:hypothetical protein GCM10012280_07750 [Wenjunlia tyrosinilytica]|uniref:Ketosynthase family 3 (KS3) domain-containing protein n=2 Tax=Wenjunlia tyrosinilytica TaxID=1544741 RepID=A0A917ZFK3_9ACTN|nr:hypothetical protein GCM10012280_07750 [Wenjunlia tyrosinilytica]
MAVLLPGAPGLAAYWRNLLDGTDAITEAPEGRWDTDFYRPGATAGTAAPDRVYCRRGGFVDEFAEVDVTRFGITPNSVAGTEPDQLIALHVAAEAVADAGGRDRLPQRHRIGVVLGRGGYLTPGLVRLDQRLRTAHQLTRTLGELLPDLRADQLDRVRAAFTERLGPDQPEAAIGLVPNLAASRIANRLDLRGPAYTVDAACASSLVAVDQAVGELASGRCDMMLAGGVHHCHDITLWSVFSQLGALSPSQRIRPLDRQADGILIGEGTGVVVLKRLDDAQRDGDRVYAVIRGTGVASDGRAAGLAAPDPGGQALAVRQAWHRAGLDPAQAGSIGLLEAHGTATPAGDAAELATLAEVFGAGGGDDRPVIGSVKSMIGHTMPAAGVAGLVKAALAVHHGVLLPTLHCDDPHPALAATRFRPLGSAEPWETTPGQPVRRAAVNAFGFGGINAHVVLEQAPRSRDRRRAAPVPGRAAAVAEPERVLTLAADTPDRLAALLEREDSAVTAAGLDGGGPPLVGRARLGIVAPNAKRLALARRAVAGGRAWRGRGDVWFSPSPLLEETEGAPVPAGRLAFVFPGLEGDFAPRVDDVAGHFGLPLPGPALPGPALHGHGVPAGARDVGRHGAGVIGVGRLLDAALRRIGIVPDAVAGHSVGEWTAMAAGGMYSGEAVDAFLESFDPDSLTVPGLAFAALGTSAERAVAEIKEWGDDRIVLSHDNAPHQSMVCGPTEPVGEFVRSVRARGVLCRVLPFQSGFHTPMLAPYLAPIRRAAESFSLHPPDVPVWSATTASPFPSAEAETRALFVRHLLEPVRFRALIEAMYACGFRAFVQVGGGRLGSLIGDTLGGREHLVVAANSPRRDGLAQLRRVATALWVEGVRVRADSLAPVGVTESSGPRTAPPSRTAVRPPSRTAVRLRLGSGLVSLDERSLAGLRGSLRGAGNALPYGAPAALRSVGGHLPAAAELDALLRETADAAAAVVAAAGPAGGLAAAAPAAPTRTSASATAHRPVPPPGPPPPGGDVASPPPATSWRTTVRVCAEEMPYLLDHCFFPQRPGWPDPADRWPVVPATTIVQHLMDAAERAAPGERAIAVHTARFDQWVTAAPPLTVPVTAERQGAGRTAVSFGGKARAVVELAPRCPGDRPLPWRPDPSGERVPQITAAELYSERWMFHGPAFQGLTELTALSDTHVRGTITTPAAPGALLDNVGQLLGYWLMATHTRRTVVFPVQMGRIRFFGPHPAPGTEVVCLIRIVSLTDAAVEAEAQLVIGGQVWADITGWQDRRFDNDPQTRPVERFPERNTLSRLRPGGWCLVHERWPDLASRDLIMRNYLGGAERAEYERRPPRGRRQWLLGRIAVKDAVRRHLWERGEGPVFPAEIQVRNDARGKPYAVGLHGRELPELDISLAHRAETGVAMVRTGRGATGAPGAAAGIDIEEVTERTEQTLATCLGAEERSFLDALCTATGEPLAVWFTRFWAAKEAVAKAGGSGFRGRPRDFAVVDAGPGRLVLEAPAGEGAAGEGAAGEGARRRHRVRWEHVVNPPALPSRQYVVAWTTGPADKAPADELPAHETPAHELPAHKD